MKADRILTSLLAPAEKRCLIWLATRMPARVNSDHLTALGAAAMALAAVAFWRSAHDPVWFAVVIASLALNWFGDSLDGTLARVRGHERPRYGYYVDHVLDAAGILLLVGGLALSGLMTPTVALGVLCAYYLLSIEVYLAAHALGRFRISFWKIGPTELRILLAIGVLVAARHPDVSLLGATWRLFDVGGIVAIAGLVATAVYSAVSNGKALYELEPLPKGGMAKLPDCQLPN
jgi:phosphatidylglycerophosphate synthase